MTFKKLNSFANRGAKAEKAAQEYLTEWSKGHLHREFNRLVDTKAAGRIVRAACADFEFFTVGTDTMQAFSTHGLIEVKETEHEYRLSRDKVPQLPRLRKRAHCGGFCAVLVLHSTIGRWRALSAPKLAVTGDKGSWNLTDEPSYGTPGQALSALFPMVFQ